MNTSLHELFIDQLKDMLDAEMQLIEALPKMAEAATSEKLREAFETHLEETRGHADRLRAVLQELGEPGAKSCKGIKGIIAEGEELMAQCDAGPVRDTALIAAAQKAEHYEMATYGTLIAFAKEMDHHEAIDVLEENLGEEEKADKLLTQIATGGLFKEGVNERAQQQM